MRTIKPMLNFSRRIHTANPIKIGVLDVPFEKGQDKGGVANGPKLIRQAGLLKKLTDCCKYLVLIPHPTSHPLPQYRWTVRRERLRRDYLHE